MVIANAIALIAAYVLVASWAYRRGRRMLVKCAAAFLAVLVVASLVMGLVFSVPSLVTLMAYVLLLGAPIVIVPTWLLMLLYSNIDRKENALAVGPIPVALVGAAVGFVLGYMMTVVAFPPAG
jgi:putative flippase GtrA